MRCPRGCARTGGRSHRTRRSRCRAASRHRPPDGSRPPLGRGVRDPDHGRGRDGGRGGTEHAGPRHREDRGTGARSLPRGREKPGVRCSHGRRCEGVTGPAEARRDRATRGPSGARRRTRDRRRATAAKLETVRAIAAAARNDRLGGRRPTAGNGRPRAPTPLRAWSLAATTGRRPPRPGSAGDRSPAGLRPARPRRKAPPSRTDERAGAVREPPAEGVAGYAPTRRDPRPPGGRATRADAATASNGRTLGVASVREPSGALVRTRPRGGRTRSAPRPVPRPRREPRGTGATASRPSAPGRYRSVRPSAHAGNGAAAAGARLHWRGAISIGPLKGHRQRAVARVGLLGRGRVPVEGVAASARRQAGRAAGPPVSRVAGRGRGRRGGTLPSWSPPERERIPRGCPRAVFSGAGKTVPGGSGLRPDRPRRSFRARVGWGPYLAYRARNVGLRRARSREA